MPLPSAKFANVVLAVAVNATELIPPAIVPPEVFPSRFGADEGTGMLPPSSLHEEVRRTIRACTRGRHRERRVLRRQAVERQRADLSGWAVPRKGPERAGYGPDG